MAKQILVAEEKHGTYYYDASTTEALAQSALKILTERFNEGYWYYEPGDEPTYDGPDKDTIKSFKDVDEDAYQVLVKKWNNHVRKKKGWRQAKSDYDAIKQVVEGQDLGTVTVGRGKWEREVPKAWRLLDARSDHEYERVALEDLQ